jgi:site-specific DNA recombinase
MTIKTSTRRVATYERVSSADQRERETIKTQTDALTRRLAREPDIEVVARYVDDGVSGTIPLAQRPGGRRLLDDAAAGRYGELWVVTTDRLGRDAPDVLVSQRRLRWLGIRLMTLEGEVNPLVGDIMTVIDDNARLTFLANSARGMARAAREGRYTGGIVAYGYRVEGAKQTARLAPDPTPGAGELTAAGVVHHLYERLAIDGWSCRQIAAELNGLGVPTHYARDGRSVTRGARTSRTQGVWRAGRIRNMVTNPTYKGDLQFGRRIDQRSPKSPKRGHEIISARCEPLVSEELWSAAQATLAANRTIAKNTRRAYLLRGVIHCAACGLAFVGSQGRPGVGWYRCGGRTADRGPFGGRCTTPLVRSETLESIVWADVEGWLRDPGDILAELGAEAGGEGQAAIAEAESITLTRALDSLTGRRAQVLRQTGRGRFTDQEIDAELSQIETERADVEVRLMALTRAAEALPSRAALDLLGEVRARLDAGLSIAQRQEVVRLLAHIVVHTDEHRTGERTTRAVIDYRFPDPGMGGLSTRTGMGSSRRPAGTAPERSSRDQPARPRPSPPRSVAAAPQGRRDRIRATRRGTAHPDPRA